MRLLSCFTAITILLAGVSSAIATPLSFFLEEQHLGSVTEKNWPGKYLLIGIGYTSCPDICPTTVMDLSSAVAGLGAKADKIVPIFISVDPNRDSVKNIDLYVKYFSPNMVGLVGNITQTTDVVKTLSATYGYSLEGKPVYPPLPSQYEVYHSAYIYLYGPDRQLIDVFGYGLGGDKISQKIATYLKIESL